MSSNDEIYITMPAGGVKAGLWRLCYKNQTGQMVDFDSLGFASHSLKVAVKKKH